MTVNVATISNSVDYILDASKIPNIAAFSFLANTAYSLSFYGAARSSFALARNTPTTSYTTTNGFSALNSISDGANFTGTYIVSLNNTGGSSVPEPSTLALFGLGALAMKLARRKAV